jgi:hypothetical protein
LTSIKPGSRVVVRAADGELLTRRALTAVEMGSTFEVVWVCKDAEWEVATAEGREPEGMPWPADAVELTGEPVAV